MWLEFLVRKSVNKSTKNQHSPKWLKILNFIPPKTNLIKNKTFRWKNHLRIFLQKEESFVIATTIHPSPSQENQIYSIFNISITKQEIFSNLQDSIQHTLNRHPFFPPSRRNQTLVSSSVPESTGATKGKERIHGAPARSRVINQSYR